MVKAEELEGHEEPDWIEDDNEGQKPDERPNPWGWVSLLWPFAPVRSSDSQSGRLRAVTALQSDEGFWSSPSELFDHFRVNKIETFVEFRGPEEDRVFATLLAVALFRNYMPSLQASWAGAEERALSWLREKDIDVETVVAEMTSLFTRKSDR
jgi:hypothetical protein